jgi:hypothetical protein
MQPSDGIEELFEHAGSGRLDSEQSQQIDWGNSAAFGEAALLAEGAPSGSWDSAGGTRLLSGALQAEQQAAQQAQQVGGQQVAVTLPRASPFQGVPSYPLCSPPASP